VHTFQDSNATLVVREHNQTDSENQTVNNLRYHLRECWTKLLRRFWGDKHVIKLFNHENPTKTIVEDIPCQFDPNAGFKFIITAISNLLLKAILYSTSTIRVCEIVDTETMFFNELRVADFDGNESS